MLFFDEIAISLDEIVASLGDEAAPGMKKRTAGAVRASRHCWAMLA
ncbi:MAG TPA: hypothetical protein VEA17_24950 [Bordetella sp.]|nr:hypothetical protein [Bordetella sp.]